MMAGKEPIMVLCDTEEEYAWLMTDFLRKHPQIPWKIHTYTDTEELLREEGTGGITMLVVAESAYSEQMRELQPQCMVLLNESGVIRWDGVHNINKYQQADNVLRSLLELYADMAEEQLPRIKQDCGTRYVGIYSPVRRCLQTSFALTLSQLLAKEHRTLYLNFEHYVGITELLPDMQTRDLADLLYFLTAERDKFRLRMQAMIQRKGGLDYIPPMKAGQNLLSVTSVEWMSLLQKIGELGEYEYVVLDLSESVQGLFDILRMCVKIYTLTKEDRIASGKLLQYEQLLALYEYGDVMEKTKKCNLPKFRRLPDELEQYTRGDLADYVKGEVRELLADN